MNAMRAAAPPLTSSELWELPIGTPVTELLPNRHALYQTNWGAAYVGDSLLWLKELPDESIDLVVTSPPYALEFKKEYGNVNKPENSDWFRPFGTKIKRVLRSEGSFVLNIVGTYNPGT